MRKKLLHSKNNSFIIFLYFQLKFGGDTPVILLGKVSHKVRVLTKVLGYRARCCLIDCQVKIDA